MGLSKNAQTWLLIVVALLIVLAWPARDDGTSFATRFVNWVVDPRGELPVFPGTPPLDDSPELVEPYNAMWLYYHELYDKGGWTRMRLELKAARSPFKPAAVRPVLMWLAVLTAFLLFQVNRPKK